LIKFSVDRHFIYLTPRNDEHQEQLQSYYKMTEEDLEEITKEWSVDLLVSEQIQQTFQTSTAQKLRRIHLGPVRQRKQRRQRKMKEIQDVDSRSVRMASITPDQGGNDEDFEEVEQKPRRRSKEKKGFTFRTCLPEEVESTCD
jgi:hypothetical protein